MVMKLKEMVAETQSILLELDSEASELFCVAEKKLSDRDYSAIRSIWQACRIIDDDIVALSSAGRYWSGTILLRSIFDGTAKLSFLLSSKDISERDRRFDCYCEYSREKDIASLEQSSVHLLNDGEYGRGVREEYVRDTIIRQINEEKTQPGHGERNRTVANELTYKRITAKLLEEFPVWKFFKENVDNRYARANGYSHLNSWACEDIARTILNEVHKQSSDQDLEAKMSIHLVDVCVLKRVRCEAMLHAFGTSDERFCSVMKRHKQFLDFSVSLANSKVAEIMSDKGGRQ